MLHREKELSVLKLYNPLLKMVLNLVGNAPGMTSIGTWLHAYNTESNQSAFEDTRCCVFSLLQ